MRKTSSNTQTPERSGARVLAAIALIGSLAAFGCSTNKVPGNGEPAMSAPAVSSGSTTTSGTTQAMISSSPSPANGFSASVDAVATLKADEAFKGKYLGQAAPADGTTNTANSLQQVTGQFIPPSTTVNPQVTVNSSISSPPTPAIVSGAGEGVGGGGGLSVATGATVAAPAATSAGLTNATSAISSTTATPAVPAMPQPLTNATPAITTNNQMIGPGQPINARGATNTTAATTSSTQATPVTGSTGVATGLRTTPLATRAATTSAVTNPTSPSVRVVNTNGSAVVTNAPPSAFQRFMSAIGLRRSTPATSTTPPATTSPATTSTH